MKYVQFLLLTACLGLFTQCITNSQGNKPAPSNQQPILRVSFDEKSELDNWNLASSSGQTIIDDSVKFEGKGAIKFSNKEGCYSIDRKTGIPVIKGNNYQISFNILMTTDYKGCVGSFVLTLYQGNEIIQYVSEERVDHWARKTYYFEAKSNVPVTMQILVGTSSVWMDSLNVVKDYQ